MGRFAPAPLPGLTVASFRTQGSASLHPGLRSCAASRLNGSGLEGSKIKVSKSTVLRLARISRRLTVEARDRPAITWLRLLAVLNRLCRGDVGPEADAARQEARATSRLAVR